MKTDIKEIKVSYKTLQKPVNEKLDVSFEKLANEIGLELFGTGYNLKTKERDLLFKSEIIEKTL